jgi:hypothetical protein
MFGRMLTGYGAVLLAGSGFLGPMIKGDPNLAVFTLAGLTLNANGQTGITTVVDFSRPESSIRDQFIDLRITGGAAGSVIINLDGCEDTSLVRVKSETHAALPITDVVWHVPGGNLHILGCTLFNTLLLSFQEGDIIESTMGAIVLDGGSGPLNIIGGYLYANNYGGLPGNFFTTGANFFDSVTIIGCYITCTIVNTVVFRGRYGRAVNVIGCFFDATGSAGVTLFSAATVPNGTAWFIFNPLTMVSGVSLGTPAAGVKLWQYDPLNTVIDAGNVIFSGTLKVYGNIDMGGGAGGPGTVDRRGVGNPNGVTTGNMGDTYRNASGGAGQTLWVKESGNGTNTGWVAK